MLIYCKKYWHRSSQQQNRILHISSISCSPTRNTMRCLFSPCIEFNLYSN